MNRPDPAAPDPVVKFLEKHFGVGYAPAAAGPEEDTLIAGVLTSVEGKFARPRYHLGLAIDFALLAQQPSLHDPEAKPFRPELTVDRVFARYKPVTVRNDIDADTLTLICDGGAASHEVGVRRFEGQVLGLFVTLKRPGYPSAYVYNTGQWHKHKESLVLPAFKLSEAGRFEPCRGLIDFGLARLPESSPVGGRPLGCGCSSESSAAARGRRTARRPVGVVRAGGRRIWCAAVGAGRRADGRPGRP